MTNLLKRILNRFTLIVIEFRKDQGPKESVCRGKWTEKGLKLEKAYDSTEWQNDERLKEEPVLLVFTGYGVLRKEFREKTDLFERITQGEDFLWREEQQNGKDELVFVRREIVQPVLDHLEKQEIMLADISLAVGTDPVFLSKGIAQKYNIWHTRAYWLQNDKTNQVLAGLLTRRLKLPVLLLIFVLLASNHLLQRSLQERYFRQQTELSGWRRQKELQQAGNEKIQKMMQAFSGRKKLSPLVDRLAAVVPEGVTLDFLEINPPVKPAETGKALLLKENYVLIGGHTRQSADVAAFTERLGKTDPSWRVVLSHLDRRLESADFEFRIEIEL